MKKKNNIHEGHRQRLKNKFIEFGLDAFSEHEILELMLTYSIPYKDTNELDHTLLNEFDSLYGVLNAEYDELIKVNGIGRETAIYLNLLKQFYTKYEVSKDNHTNYILENLKAAVAFFRKRYTVEKKEDFYCLCLTNKYSLLKVIKFEGKDDTSVDFNIKDLLAKITATQASSVIFMHTHPFGSVSPSKQDIDMTYKLFVQCRLLGINLYDHIILNEKDYFSMKDILREMEKQFDSNLTFIYKK